MLYPLVLFVHVAAGVLLVGHSLLAPVLRKAIETADSLPALRSLVAFDRQAAAFNPIAALVLLASGIYLGSAGSWYAAWFYVAVVLWVADSALAAGVVNRAAARAQAAATAPGIAIPTDVDLLRRSRAWSTAQAIIAGNDIAVLFLMIAKPDLLQSCAAVVVANAIALAVVGLVRARAVALPPATTAL